MVFIEGACLRHSTIYCQLSYSNQVFTKEFPEEVRKKAEIRLRPFFTCRTYGVVMLLRVAESLFQNLNVRILEQTQGFV